MPPELFKGIEFVRISSLPGDQKERIWHSIQHDKIIKIVKEEVLMNDCVLYQDYLLWFHQQQAIKSSVPTSSVTPLFAKLAFK